MRPVPFPEPPTASVTDAYCNPLGTFGWLAFSADLDPSQDPNAWGVTFMGDTGPCPITDPTFTSPNQVDWQPAAPIVAPGTYSIATPSEVIFLDGSTLAEPYTGALRIEA